MSKTNETSFGGSHDPWMKMTSPDSIHKMISEFSSPLYVVQVDNDTLYAAILRVEWIAEQSGIGYTCVCWSVGVVPNQSFLKDPAPICAQSESFWTSDENAS